MKDIKTKIKRQTELLGLVINFPNECKIHHLEEIFGVNEPTIKRDLQELRNYGIAIHSQKGKGVNVYEKIRPEIIKNILNQYIGITINRNAYVYATNLLVKKLLMESISTITILQQCIEKHLKAKIKYSKPEDRSIEEREIKPYCIFQGDKNWRLLAEHNGVIKQFIINRIISLTQLDSKFTPISSEKIDEIFSTSFRSWLGNERHKVRIKFYPPWSKRIKPRQLMESQKIVEEPDGSIVYETIVNSLSEIASWIVSRGRGVIVLEPEELKKLVIKTAEETLMNYNKKDR